MTIRPLLCASFVLLASGCGREASAPAPAEPAPIAPTAPPSAQAPLPAPVRVSVRADTVLSSNGSSAIPDGLFGVTAYAGASAGGEPAWRATLLGSGMRWAGLPAHPNWVFGEELPEGFAAGWAEGAAATARLDAPSPGYHIPRSVRGWRDLGIEPMVYLLGYPAKLDGGVSADGKTKIPDCPNDIAAAARMWAEYVAWVRRADPALTWLHLGNEDNAYWWKLQKYGADYAALFNAVATAVKARNPGVKLGGPVPCWAPSWPPAQDGTPDWYTWTQWTAPFIAASGANLDFFDFHLYEAGPGIGDEEVQTVANAMWLATGQRKPVLITEYGVYLKAEDQRSATRVWGRRVEPWQHQLMDFLDLHADTVLSLQPHDLFAEAGGQFMFLKGRDPADQYPLYRAYQAWAPFRGTRLDCRSGNPAVRSFAAVASDELDGSRSLAVVLVNTGDGPQEVSLDLAGAELRPGPVRQRSFRLVAAPTAVAVGGTGPQREGFQNAEQGGVNAGPAAAPGAKPAAPVVVDDGSRFEYGESVSDRLPTTLTLAAHETRSYAAVLAARSPAPGREHWLRTAFGDAVHHEFEKDGAAVAVHFTPPVGSARRATLRLGLLGARAGDRIEVAIDGTTVVAVNDWFQEIALPRIPATDGGRITANVTLVTRGSPQLRPKTLRLGSAVLVYEGEDAYAPAPVPSVAADAPAIATWSFAPRTAAPSALEDPWSGAIQSVTNLPLHEALVPGPAPGGSLVANAHGGVERSPAASVLFRAPSTGWYRVVCEGHLAGRSNPTAGNALVTAYVLPPDAHAVRELKTAPLNAPGGFGGHPQDLAWTERVWLRAGWRLGIALQVVSPGPANAGRAELVLGKLEVGYVGEGR